MEKEALGEIVAFVDHRPGDGKVYLWLGRARRKASPTARGF